MPNVVFSDADKRDTQALVKTAFDDLSCTLLLLRVVDRAAARAWLRGQVNNLARVDQIGRDKPKVTHTIQMALTAAGLRALGHNGLLNQFASEFTTSMAEDTNRLRRLGDIARNDPKNWRWGIGAQEPHVLLMVFGESDIGERARRVESDAQAAGLSKIESLPTGGMDGVEPFGFKDGVSQPSIDWDGTRDPGSMADMDYHNLIALGEFLLGYPNEYGLYTERPLLPPNTPGAQELPAAEDQPQQRDLGRNGSYLVFRQLRQDVNGFWRWAYKESGGNHDAAMELAEAVVGRRTNGDPFAKLGNRNIPGVKEAKDGEPRNDFIYASDRSGQVCPIGAHIRRANPRTGDYPNGRTGLLKKLITLFGLTGTAEEDRIASARFHRLLRRGREYGTALEPIAAARAAGEGPEAGLHFMCLNANLARQFEFIQGAWLASAKFAGMTNEQDPMLGNREPFPGSQPTDRFTRPQEEGPCRVSKALPQFITVRGGAYFFLPGARALAWLLRDQ